MKRYLAATTPWLGGKRSIARDIMRTITRESGLETPGRIADAFSGAASMSIAAKALGWAVDANDMSPIAEAVGQALLVNRTQQLSSEEIALALTGELEAELPSEKELALPQNCRKVLARMVGYERGPIPAGPSRWLVRAWIAKTAISMATWGIPTMAAGLRTWDELTPGQAQQLKRTGRPSVLAAQLAQALNQGVFDNGRTNTFTRGDAIEFLANAEADVAYLDPPYPGTLSYEKVYAGVSHLLDPEVPTDPSPWSAKDGWELLAGAFDAAEDIPLVVVSMGQGASPERMLEMLTERGRDASCVTLDLQHLSALKAEHGEGGDELLVVGRR